MEQYFENLPNFRDIGGLPAADGRAVRRGLVFRSGDLSRLADDEVARLGALNIRTVVDFRSKPEILCSPDILPPTATTVISVPIDAETLINSYGGTLNRRKAMGLMVSVYRQFAADLRAPFARFFEALSAEDAAPLLFHCTAGKDRTGFAAALFLTALGVERGAVMEDYLKSRELLGRKYVKGRDYDDACEPLHTVFPEFLEEALRIVDSFPGGADGYLRGALGADPEALRRIYTDAL